MKVCIVFWVVSGNFLEMYDFMVYGYYVLVIVKMYFLSGNVFVLLMLLLLVFGVGFLMWLVGVIVFGVYIDYYGCCKGLILMFGLMVIGMFMVVVILGYVMIGVFVLVFVLFGWLL